MRTKFLALLGLLLATFLWADNPCQSAYGPYGPVTCSTGETSTVSANGPVTLNGTTVRQSTSVNGVLSATKSHFNGLIVNGTVNLVDSFVNGETNINGVLMANNTVFNNTITISTDNFTLLDTTTKNIIIHGAANGIVAPQVLNLTGKTQINGTITFTENDGVVNIGSGVKITGKIIGGQIKMEPTAKPAT